MPDVQASRELLFPGPQPPLSHFGATLLRHVAITGLRYAVYQLGHPVPERAPVRITALRLYLDAGVLRAALAGEPGGEALLGALIDPGGAEPPARGGRSDERRTGRSGGIALFHRVRLRLARAPRRRRPPPRNHGESTPRRLWEGFRRELTRRLPELNDAFLAEVLAALGRRRWRGRGREVPPCLGQESWRLRAGRPARLHCLGDPDPLAPSWATDPGAAARAAGRLAAAPLPPCDKLRGRFRERYRAALDGLGARYRLLAVDAVRRGLLDDPGDALFLPFDLAEDLAGDRRPGWLAAAVAANRREHRSLLGAVCPPAALTAGAAEAAAALGPDAWPLAPLQPLP